MSSIVVSKARVENFESWKSGYDQGEAIRREFRVRGIQVLRDASDPNIVLVLTRFDSVDDAKKMLSSERWQEGAKRSGAQMLETHFANVVDDRTY
jgi:hypothetical protein